MRRAVVVWIVMMVMGTGASRGQEGTDPGTPEIDMLGRALDAVGRARADLGYHPRGYWVRYPIPERTPYLLPFFTDLFAEPLHIYDYTVGFGAATAQYLPEAYRAEHDDAARQLLYYLGVSRRHPGFRGYSANLLPPDSTDTPLLDALREFYAQGGWPIDGATFGQTAPWPQSHDPLAVDVATLPGEIRQVVAGLVQALADACRWHALAFRNVPTETRARVFRIRRLGESQPDGTVYYPEMDDLARDLDEPSLLYAATKTVAAVERARAQLDSLSRDDARVLEAFEGDPVVIRSPFGAIVIAGTGNDEHVVRDVLCLVDLGGDDTYRGGIGATTSLDTPVSIALDYRGRDRYLCRTDDLPSQGAGVLGVGVLWDADGDDEYETRNLGQGAGLFGVGVLLDEGGDDHYTAELSAQGAAFFGIGLLLEGDGSDTYDLDGDGQGYGGVGGGVGVLADASGDDRYYCEPYADKVGRADYHSDYKVAASHAQGVGSGRRGDGADGHAWAGGLGVLVDLVGDDHYEAGNWSQGTGYWYGTGLLYDGAGDDQFRSVYFTQASGAHFAIGAIVDEGGDDTHELFENAGAGLAFGWDFTHALLFDRSGNDTYRAKIISLGLSDIRSHAFLVDLSGDDLYQLDSGQPGFGAADFRPDYRDPDLRAPYNAYTRSFGFLLDGGGEDRYLVRDPETDAIAPHDSLGDSRVWLEPSPGSEGFGYENHGGGVDCENGVVPEWERFRPAP